MVGSQSKSIIVSSPRPTSLGNWHTHFCQYREGSGEVGIQAVSCHTVHYAIPWVAIVVLKMGWLHACQTEEPYLSLLRKWGRAIKAVLLWPSSAETSTYWLREGRARASSVVLKSSVSVETMCRTYNWKWGYISPPLGSNSEVMITSTS